MNEKSRWLSCKKIYPSADLFKFIHCLWKSNKLTVDSLACMNMTTENKIALKVNKISKAFPGVKALD